VRTLLFGFFSQSFALWRSITACAASVAASCPSPSTPLTSGIAPIALTVPGQEKYPHCSLAAIPWRRAWQAPFGPGQRGTGRIVYLPTSHYTSPAHRRCGPPGAIFARGQSHPRPGRPGGIGRRTHRAAAGDGQPRPRGADVQLRRPPRAQGVDRRAGVTFKYGPKGPEGLLTWKKVYCALARGGAYRDTKDDTQVPWLKKVLGFLGIPTSRSSTSRVWPAGKLWRRRHLPTPPRRSLK